MKIIKITILHSTDGTDTCILKIDMPSPLPKMGSNELQTEFLAERNTGKKYCEKNFPGVPIEIIEI